jgi:GAF domain-containing protein
MQLGALNASTTHRYTGLLRFDGAELASVWTFDRERPRADPFPLRLRIADTPCELVRSARTAIALEDTWRDGRAATRGSAHGMRALVGVPLAGDNGALYGALCHFDPEPRAPLPHALDLLERVARMFRFLSAKNLRQSRDTP